MNKFVRVAQTSQTLSLAAMEEASRLGIRVADIDHLFLALVINDQPAGRALRSMGIDLDRARRAVEEQHAAQLASLGIEASFPEAGRIVFHETDGYEWSARASDLIGRSANKDKEGDAAAVLRELLAEPSGLLASILDRLETTPEAVLEQLDQRETDASPKPKVKGRATGSTETFVSAPIDTVWEFLADPAHVPDWELGIDSIDLTDHAVTPGTVWQAQALTSRPDGKPIKIKPQYRRRTIELVAAEPCAKVTWRSGFPDVPRGHTVLTEFSLAEVTGGTQVTITTSWSRRGGWRRIVGLPLRPLQKFILWITLFQTGSAISRAFR